MKTCIAAMLLVACASPAAWAQFEDDRAVELTRAAIQNERQAILTANLALAEEQAAAFWPLHDAYRADLEGAIDTRVDLLKKYFASYETMTDAEAKDLFFEYVAWDQRVLDIRKKHAKRMMKALPARLVAKFFQIENKMDVIVEYEMASEIPLLK
jgi:hypothetical protein